MCGIKFLIAFFFNGRPYHPLDNMPEYGENIGNFVGLAAIMLHLEFTHEQKRELLVDFIQYGIDLYGVCRAETGNVTWPGGGGQSSGRKWPVLFAGIMLADTSGMMAIGDKSGDYARINGEFSSATRVGPTLPDDYIHFGEDDQTFYVTQEEIDAHAAYFHNQNPGYAPPNGEQSLVRVDQYLQLTGRWRGITSVLFSPITVIPLGTEAYA
jgi:hypothetical protein